MFSMHNNVFDIYLFLHGNNSKAMPRISIFARGHYFGIILTGIMTLTR
jgi:hypothetical protein